MTINYLIFPAYTVGAILRYKKLSVEIRKEIRKKYKYLFWASVFMPYFLATVILFFELFNF